jgi:hypothetical protein
VSFTPASSSERSAALDNPVFLPGGVALLDCVELTVGCGVVFAGAWISGGGDAITRTGGLGLLASGWGSRVASGRAAHCRSGSISL